MEILKPFATLTSRPLIQFISDRRYGIIGTILVHMALLVVILFVKVNQREEKAEELIYIDIKTLEEIRKLEMVPTTRQPAARSREARNIAVNQEDRVEKYEDYQNYQPSRQSARREAQNRNQQAVKDIIKENNLNPDDKELPPVEEKPTGFYEAKKIEEDQVYKGPTNIYFKLDDRKVTYLPIPVYKCKGGATVQVDIRVGQRGKVEWTSINASGTDTRDPCFLDAAKEAAQKTRFSFSASAPMLQQGYIIYHFVAQ